MITCTGSASANPLVSGQAAVFFLIAEGVISEGGMGPMIPYLFRVGIR